MHDVAKACGVSAMTVSRALRNESQISEATTRLVLAKADELGYRPDPELSKLMNHLRKRTASDNQAPLALVTAFDSRDGWKKSVHTMKCFEGAKKRAQQFGYGLEFFWLSEPGMTPRRMSEILINRGIRGILFSPLPQVGVVEGFQWDHFACSTMGYSLWEPQMQRACSNQFQCLDLAFRKGLEYGYQRIGMLLHGDLDKRVSHRYLAAYHYHQTLIDETDRIPPLDISVDNLSILSDWLLRYQPDLLIVSDVWAHISDQCRRTAPGDLAFLALNSSLVDPAFAGIDHHPEHVGAAAIDLIDVQLRNNLYGLPELTNIMQIEATWRDGPSMPNRSK